MSAPLTLADLPELLSAAATVPDLRRELAELRAEVESLRSRTVDPLEDLATPEQIVASGVVTMGQLRDRLKFRHRNGLSKYVSVRNRRLFISRKGFARWLRQQSG